MVYVNKEQVINRKANLSPTKQALLEKRLRGDQESIAGDKTPDQKLPIVLPDLSQRYQPFPLTDIQQAYWLGRNSTFDLGNVSTHGYIEIDSIDLDLNRFEHAWQRLVERHEMLRVIIHSDGQQQILEHVPAYKIEVLDLRTQNPDRVTDQVISIRKQLSHQILPAHHYPLFEIRAAQLTEKVVRLFISFDFLIGDGRSLTIISRELAQIMETPECPLPPLKLSFRDYVLTQVALRNSESYQRSLEYWQNRLLTLPPSPELPLDKHPASIKNPQFVRRSGRLEADIWTHLKQRANLTNLTPSGLLLAAFAEVLTAWSKSPQFTINLTLFNRPPLHPQINQIVGDFTSLTLLAINNFGQDSFTTRAKRIQKQLWQDLDHQSVGGVHVLREMTRIHDHSSRILMPIVFTSSLINESVIGETAVEKTLPMSWLGEVVHSIGQTAQVYLDHQIAEVEGALIYVWDAVEEIFPPNLLDEMFSAYSEFLQQLATSEHIWQAPVRNLALSAQKQSLMNTSVIPLPHNALLHTLFFEQAKRSPDQLAVVTSQRTLTYQELSVRASHIGHYLRQQDVRPNQLVAIVMEKGWEQVVAALGILASGAAYVPINPGLPTERQHYLLKQAKVEWVLTQSKLDSALNWPESIRRLCIDTLSPIPSKWQCVQNASDLAYVIYTSGSTGLPKGVMIDHQGAVNTILDINRRFNITSSDRTLALSSLSFDLSVFDIFGTLAAGGTIVIPDPDESKNPAHWAELMTQQQVTIWNSVPALMQMLVEYSIGSSSLFSQSLRLVLLSGDWIPLTLPNQVRSLCQDIELVSLGGATEASIWSILYPIEQIDSSWKSIPYGRPMDNQRFYVLNEMLEACPTWVPGQLYIGGIGLAKGYWQDEEKTQASFLVHPQTQERLYKTGDLGCYLPDGNIEFLGREDFQVKLNGYRIELGEIEAIIDSHPVVQKSLILAMGEQHNSRQLVAFIVMNQAHKADDLSSEVRQEDVVNKLRAFLYGRLPEYMVPSMFKCLDALPLSSNGKIDRKALSKIAISQKSETNHILPYTMFERTLANIFRQVVQIENIGIYDNFFELGANSIHIVQIHGKIREIIKKDIPVTEIFRYPTINSLDEYLSNICDDEKSSHHSLGRAQSRKKHMKTRQERR